MSKEVFDLDDFNSFSSRTNQFQDSEANNKLKAAKAIVFFNKVENSLTEEIDEIKNKLERLQSQKVRLNQAIVGIDEQVKFKYPVAIEIDNTTYIFEKDLNVKTVNEVFGN